MTVERMNEGIARLLAAPADLALSGATVVAYSPAANQASKLHRDLFQKYRKELKTVLGDAVQWWDHRTQSFEEELGNAKQARLANWREFPAGPVSDPYTVAVLREYWLACDALNAKVTPQVAPEQFLLQWVLDEGDMATAELLSAMPYWPVGMDASGHWR
jgi:hypothetical protein